MDYLMFIGKIVVYKIMWFNGVWFGWFVFGINDFDGKFNIKFVICGSFFKKGNIM